MNHTYQLSLLIILPLAWAGSGLIGCTSDDSPLFPADDSGLSPDARTPDDDAMVVDDAMARTGDGGSSVDAEMAECASPADCGVGLPVCGVATCEEGRCGIAPSPAGLECRASVGACDLAEACDGTATDCPADSTATAGTECRASTGVCDIAEACDGSGAECPADALAPAGIECRASAGACDIAEACDGSGTECPADALAPAGIECRASAGVCDTAEACNGARAECPRDGFAPDTLVCRTPVHRCDATESCPGTAALCPADSPAAGCAPADGSTPIRYSALGRNLTINSVQINTVAQTAITVRAGTSVTVSIDGLWTNAGTSCPGCITQFYLRVAGEANVCLGSATGGTRFSRKFITFTPMVPGTYYANLTQGWDFSCSDSTRVGASYSPTGTVAIISVE